MEFRFIDPVEDFSNGLVALKTYHEDILQTGEKLLKLVDEIKQHGINQDLAIQCMNLYCYYEHANHLHHQDEEQALFPLLIGKSPLVDGMMERLILDHEEIEKAWKLLAEKLCKPELISNYDELIDLAKDFEKQQREHLTREDEDFSPKVKEIINDDQVKHVGQKMAQLRHLA